MKRMFLALLLTPMVMALPAGAATGISEGIARTAERGQQSLAVVEGRIVQGSQTRQLAGQAICLDAENGVFLTMALPTGLEADTLEELSIVLPGVERKTVGAKLLGVDPATSLGFVQATEKVDCKPIAFAAKSNLSIGDRVYAAGITPGDAANTPYVGVAYVSAKVRMPDQLVRVTGGSLTGPCSPVFDESGTAVGLVARQLYQTHQSLGRGGAVRTPLRNLDSTKFFMPVEEFVHVFRRIPQGGKSRRPGWIGCGFRAIPEEINFYDRPAVKIHKVIEGQPADRAGLQDEDVLIAVDGEPLEPMATPAMVRANLIHKLARVPVGERLRLKVMRDGKPMEVSVNVAEMPTTASEAPRFASQQLGLIGREKIMLDRYLGDPETANVDGLIVMQVLQNSPASNAGLANGDLITHVGQTPVETVQDIQSALQSAVQARADIKLVVRRDDTEQVITIPVR